MILGCFKLGRFEGGLGLGDRSAVFFNRILTFFNSSYGDPKSDAARIIIQGRPGLGTNIDFSVARVAPVALLSLTVGAEVYQL